MTALSRQERMKPARHNRLPPEQRRRFDRDKLVDLLGALAIGVESTMPRADMRKLVRQAKEVLAREANPAHRWTPEKLRKSLEWKQRNYAVAVRRGLITHNRPTGQERES